MLREVRRIVTGHDAEGRSIIVSDRISPHTKPNPAQPARGLTDLWRTNATPADNAIPGDAAAVEVVLNPPANGSVFRYFQIAPESWNQGKSEAEKKEVARQAFEAMGATHNQDADARHPGMHKTDTVDYIILLQGEVTMLVDDGEVAMKPLDVVIQRGTNHSWVNTGDEPAVLAGILIDADAV